MRFLHLILASGSNFLLASLPMYLSDGNATGTVIFRSGDLAEIYDFGTGRSHMGGHTGYRIERCSNPQYHCAVGITAILAPRSCKLAKSLLEGKGDWPLGERFRVRHAFRTADGLHYFVSRDMERDRPGSSGFAYRPRLGIVATWHSARAVGAKPSARIRSEIMAQARSIESQRPLFACEKKAEPQSGYLEDAPA